MTPTLKVFGEDSSQNSTMARHLPTSLEHDSMPSSSAMTWKFKTAHNWGAIAIVSVYSWQLKGLSSKGGTEHEKVVMPLVRPGKYMFTVSLLVNNCARYLCYIAASSHYGSCSVGHGYCDIDQRKVVNESVCLGMLSIKRVSKSSPGKVPAPNLQMLHWQLECTAYYFTYTKYPW